MSSSAVEDAISDLPPAEAAEKPRRRLPLVEQYLREQQQLTAVERFAQQHGKDARPAQERYYRSLLPTTPPAAGQQYAFQVDLDACTGCKACVTACHNLNGLDAGETWRAVGLLHGGSAAAPVKQSVTTACHHCLEPACMTGCPVGAYEKDATTGIVRHLDDQCIGCQYCTLMCPYEVPQYNAARGIVRKCDMCSDRLAVGEAPACVQACPSGAIAIAVVDTRQTVEDAEGDAFLPGAPSPSITLPTTVYKTARVLPRNLLPADFYVVRPSPQHLPLVVMLVLTQLSVGAFWVDALASRAAPGAALAALRPLHALVALAVGVVALGASVLHLGRPLYAFRALIGLRTSWMSREILTFGLFAPLAGLYAASLWHAPIARALGRAALSPASAGWLQETLRGAVALAGLLGLVSSVMIYHATRRVWWSGPATGFRFVATAVILGLATTLTTFAVGAALLHGAPTDHVATAVTPLAHTLARLLAAASAAKLAWEVSVFRHLRDKRHTPLRRAAMLLRGDLAAYAQARAATLVLGGIVLPLWQLGEPASAPAAAASLALLVTSELLERCLFFAAASSPGMPGGLA